MDYSLLTREYPLSTLVEGLVSVLQSLQRLRGRLALPDNDGRQVALFGMQEALLGICLTVHAISGAGLSSRVRSVAEVRESFRNLVTVAGKTEDDLLTHTETVWRLSVLSLFHFKLDSLFQNLLRALSVEPGRNGFGKNCNALITRLTLAAPAKDLEILAALTQVRNSLHNNGIHRGPDWGPLATNGLAFSFVRDSDVRCASFGHILALLNATVDVLEDVLTSPEIHAITTVPELYAELTGGPGAPSA